MNAQSNPMTDDDGRRTPATTLAIEPMTAEDLSEVVEMEQVSFATPWQKQDFDRALAQPGGLCRVARQEDALVGYAVGYRVQEEYHLTDLAIHPELRGRGLGGALVDVLLGELSGLGVRVVSLEVRASNDPATRLYKRRGFQTIAVRRDYYREPTENAVVMLKPMEGSLSDYIARAHPSGDTP